MPSTMKKNMATSRPGRLTRGRGSNSSGNDKDGGQQDRKCSLVGRKSVDNHGHGHDVVSVGKAESDLRQDHLTTESLWVEMERILAQKSSFVSLACEV